MRLARFNVETETDDDHLNLSACPHRRLPAPLPALQFCFTPCGAKAIRLPVGANIDWYLRRVLPAFTLALSA